MNNIADSPDIERSGMSDAQTSAVERIIAAAEAVVNARAELDAAVASARAFGGSWEMIGAALRRAGLRIGDVLRAIH